MNKKLAACLAGILCTVISLTTQAAIIATIPDWSTSISSITSKGTGVSNASITNIPDGVILHYDALTDGFGIGTDLRQYDFTTTATVTGAFNFKLDVDIFAFTGYFIEKLFLGVVKNSTAVNVSSFNTRQAPQMLIKL